jgi:hypothetical protein
MIKDATNKLHALPAALALAFLGMALSAFSSPASAGCVCRNYTGVPFCAKNIPACQNKAGNCMEECTWHKSDDMAKEPKKKSAMGL